MNKPYWHETIKTEEDFDKLCKPDYTTEDVMNDFQQPDWCNYPSALNGDMGCWSLWYQMVTGRDYCKNCECSRDCKK